MRVPPQHLIRSWALRSGVLYQPPHFLLPRSDQTSVLSALSDSQTAEVWDPLPDLPISSHRNSTNESLWGTDAGRAAWTKTTCHSHLMTTHTLLCHRGFRGALLVCWCICECNTVIISVYVTFIPYVLNVQTVFTHPSTM